MERRWGHNRGGWGSGSSWHLRNSRGRTAEFDSDAGGRASRGCLSIWRDLAASPGERFRGKESLSTGPPDTRARRRPQNSVRRRSSHQGFGLSPVEKHPGEAAKHCACGPDGDSSLEQSEALGEDARRCSSSGRRCDLHSQETEFCDGRWFGLQPDRRHLQTGQKCWLVFEPGRRSDSDGE